MEMKDLYNQWQRVLCDIYSERYTGEPVPGLPELIEQYKANTTNHAAALRKKSQLTHKGQPVLTKPDFKKICIAEGWEDFLYDLEVETNA